MENLATIAAIAGGALYFLTRKKADTATTPSAPVQSIVAVAAEVPAVTPVLAAPRIVVQLDSVNQPRMEGYFACVLIDGVSYVLTADRFASLARIIEMNRARVPHQERPSAALMTADLDAMVAQQGLDATVFLLKSVGMTEAELTAQKRAAEQLRDASNPSYSGRDYSAHDASLAARVQIVAKMNEIRARLQTLDVNSTEAAVLRAELARLSNSLALPAPPPVTPQSYNYMPTGLAPARAPSLTLNVPKFTNLALAKTYTVPTYPVKQTSPVTTYATPTVKTVTSGPSLAYTTTTAPNFSIKPTTSTNLTYRVG